MVDAIFFCVSIASIVTIVTKAIPLEIIKNDSGELVLIWGEAEMVNQRNGQRPKPVLRESSRNKVSVTSIIAAIGQDADYSFFPENIAKKSTFTHGRVKTNEMGQTDDPKIFAGGDIVNALRDAISAIADGHVAAKGIDEMLK